MLSSSAVLQLTADLPKGVVLTGDDIPSRNFSDASRLPPTCPAALVLPRTPGEVARAVSICAEHRQPIVIQGGLTGLAGGAHPCQGEIAISLEKLVGIEEIDQVSGTMTVLAGTPLYKVQQAAEEGGWFYPVDLGARGTCTIGGNVATNAGGNQVLRFGMTRRQILGLEVVLPTGRIVTGLNKMLKNNAGYDWTQLLIGSEGTLGVITRVVLKLVAPVGQISSAVLAVESTDKALAALRRLERELPSGLLAFESMWREFLRLAETVGANSPFSGRYDVNLLVEAPSVPGVHFEEVLAGLADDNVIADAVIAKSEAERSRFWAMRESSYEFVPKLPRGVSFDVSIPLNCMSEAIEEIRSSVQAIGSDVRWIIFGHLADSNIHVRVFPPSWADETKSRIENIVYGVVARNGGSVSAEHGVGRLKRAYLGCSRSSAELDLMASIKDWLDPGRLFNAGRVIPEEGR